MPILLETWTIAAPEAMARCIECHRNLEVGATVVVPNRRSDLPCCSEGCAREQARRLSCTCRGCSDGAEHTRGCAARTN